MDSDRIVSVRLGAAEAVEVGLASRALGLKRSAFMGRAAMDQIQRLKDTDPEFANSLSKLVEESKEILAGISEGVTGT